MHSFLFAPYFSWRVSHNRHHSYHGSMEKDELFVPQTRSEMGIPDDADAHYFEDLVEDTPIYVLLTLLRQQIFGFHAYLSKSPLALSRTPTQDDTQSLTSPDRRTCPAVRITLTVSPLHSTPP